MQPIFRMLALAAVAIGLLAAGPQPARADAVDDALASFQAGGFDAVEAGIRMLAATGDERAIDIITALSQGRLVAGEAGVFIRGEGDALLAARTGAPAAAIDASGLRPVRLNNRVRRGIAAAIGALTLRSADPAKRLIAARQAFDTRDAALLPLIEEALAEEPDDRIRRTLEQAHAAIVLADTASPLTERVAATAILAERGDRQALTYLNAVPADAPDELREATTRAAAAIEKHLAMLAIGQNVAYGISLGSVLLLAAIGLAITFGVMGVINMAHGEMVMIGAYTTFVVQETIRTNAPWLFEYSLAISVPLAFLAAGAIGVAIERGIIRWLYGRPLETLLATWGLSLMIQQAVRSIFGSSNREVGTPQFMSGSVDILGLTLTWNRVAIVIFALVVFFLLLMVLKHTALGLQVRAVTQNRRMASAMGIRTDWIDAMTFGLGSGVAGMAGVALSQIDNVSPNLGQGYIIDSFMVVVFGGVGNLWGTLVGALSIGVANKMLEPYAGAVLGKIILLVLVILFIQKRPRGLFALKGRAVEA